MTNQEFLSKIKALQLGPEDIWNDFEDVALLPEDQAKAAELQKLYEDTSKKRNGAWDDKTRAAWQAWVDFEQASRKRKYTRVIGEFKIVFQEGGNEGEGEHVELVVFFEEHNKYLRAFANYYSYDGISNWQDWKVVTPKEKTVTYYE